MDYSSDDSDDCEMEEPLQDRLSELPDSLILLILSLLSMKDVVRTTILSKRWKDLWTTVPCLDFRDEKDRSYGFQRFVSQAVYLWKGDKILKFKVSFSFRSPDYDVDSWLRFAVKNKVEELGIGLMNVWDMMSGYHVPKYWAPQYLYSCSSIRKLSLLACNLEVNGNVQWNQLKSLRIDGVQVTEHAIEQLLSGAPQLEVFTLRSMESYENLSIRSVSLRKLAIEKYLSYPSYPAKDTTLSIWIPNHETLEFAGVSYSKCLLMNVSSLTDANLGFDNSQYSDKDFPWRELIEGTMKQIFPTIHQVEKVTLSDYCIQLLRVMKREYLLSPSSNVKLLKVNPSFIAPEEMMALLEIFPKLEMFVVEQNTDYLLKEDDCQTFCKKLIDMERNYMELETNLCKSFSWQLRTVEITWYLDEASVFSFVEFLLKHAGMLKKTVIWGGIVGSHDLFLAVVQKMLSMQRSFPSVELILRQK